MSEQLAEQPKKRGRPPKAKLGNAFDNAIDIGNIDGEITDFSDNAELIAGENGENAGTSDGNVSRTDQPAKRGRPPKAKSQNYSAKVPVSTEGIETVLLSIHAMLASITKEPSFALSDKDAKALSHGITGVAKFYPSFGIDPKIAAWGALIMIVFHVYSPKAIAIYKKKANNKNGEILSAG